MNAVIGTSATATTPPMGTSLVRSDSLSSSAAIPGCAGCAPTGCGVLLSVYPANGAALLCHPRMHLLVLAGALTRHNGHYGNGVTPNNCYSGSGRSTPYLAAEGAFGAASQGRFNSFVYQSKGGQDAIGLQSVAFPSASLGVAVGLQWGKSSQAACDDDYCEKVDSMIPNILTTADGGKTWQARRGTTNPANRGSAVAHESISSLLLPETSVCGPVTPLFSPLRDVGCAICWVWAYSHRL